MKKFIALVALMLTTSAFAASVKVTSFVYIRSGEPTAELCGVVEGATAPVSYVKVLIDHKTNRPAAYNTVAGADGKFCVSVITYRGTAETSVFGETSSTSAIAK